MSQELTEQQKSDFDFFVKNKQILFEKYGECVLAISNKEILGVYDNYSLAVNETLKTNSFGSFIVQRCSADESCYIASIGGYI